MTKATYYFSAFLTLLALAVSPCRAQDFNFTKAYDDYLFNFNQYQKAHQEYVAAKSAYLTYQTLTAKTEAFDKTLALLQWRDKTVETYLTALRLRLAEATGVTDYEETVLYLKLDNEIGWYQNHYSILPSGGSPEDLFKTSEEAEDQFSATEILAFQTVGAVLNGKIDTHKLAIQNNHDILKTKIAEIRQRGDKDTAVLERWLLEAENKLTRVQEKQFEALQIITTVSGSKKIDKYTEARLKFKEAGQYLIEANHYLLEIVREIKLAD